MFWEKMHLSCQVQRLSFPFLAGRVLHYNTLALILMAAFSRKHEQGYKLKWNIYLSAV